MTFAELEQLLGVRNHWLHLYAPRAVIMRLGVLTQRELAVRNAEERIVVLTEIAA